MPDGPSRPDRPMPEKDRASVARSSTDQTSLNANTRQRSATRHGSPTPDTNADSGWTYKETIDEGISTIRVHGRVGKLGVDLLRGTIEELSRRGHRNIRVTMEHPDDVDACARDVLAEVAAWLAVGDGRLTILWSAGEQGGRPDEHCDLPRQRVDGRRPGRRGTRSAA
jgi:hypothetical protein